MTAFVVVALFAGLTAGAQAGSKAAGAASAKIQRGGTLNIAIQDDVRAGGNLQAHDVVDNIVYGSTVYDPLFTVGANGRPAPALATSGVPSNGGRVWTLTIRKGVKFTDGKPFTATSVKQNFDAFLNPKNASPVADNLPEVASYKVTGPYTFKVTLKTPDDYWTYNLMDNAYMGDMTKYNPNDPIGTGPYEYVSHSVGSQISFKRNPGYWRGNPPLDGVVFKVITTPQLAALALQKGTVDMVPAYLDATTIQSILHTNGIKLYTTSGNDNFQGFFDFEKERRGGYKNGLDVREGLAYLINTPQIVPPLVGVFGKLATQPIPPGELGYDKTIGPWPFDVAKGEALLAAGGIPKGGTITLYTIQRTDLCPVATAFQAELISLGYKATLQCLQNEVAANVVQNYNWDMFFWHNGENDLAVSAFEDVWNINNAPDPPTDIFTLRDPNLQAVINKMAATTDPTAYANLVKQASNIVMKKDVATVVLYFNRVWVAARSNVHGVIASPQNDYGLLMNAITTVWKSK
ncbi:MAG TPA: ABC transporter substrate-binding protein [Gaiellaceae bacterium]